MAKPITTGVPGRRPGDVMRQLPRQKNQGAAGSLAGMLAASTGLSPVMVGRAAELAATRDPAART